MNEKLLSAKSLVLGEKGQEKLYHAIQIETSSPVVVHTRFFFLDKTVICVCIFLFKLDKDNLTCLNIRSTALECQVRL